MQCVAVLISVLAFLNIKQEFSAGYCNVRDWLDIFFHHFSRRTRTCKCKTMVSLHTMAGAAPLWEAIIVQLAIHHMCD